MSSEERYARLFFVFVFRSTRLWPCWKGLFYDLFITRIPTLEHHPLILSIPLWIRCAVEGPSNHIRSLKIRFVKYECSISQSRVSELSSAVSKTPYKSGVTCASLGTNTCLHDQHTSICKTIFSRQKCASTYLISSTFWAMEKNCWGYERRMAHVNYLSDGKTYQYLPATPYEWCNERITLEDALASSSWHSITRLSITAESRCVQARIAMHSALRNGLATFRTVPSL